MPEQTHIDTPEGRLFAARWSANRAARSDHAPIVLFHDSLGCLALWREFPEALCQATGRDVIAYDRLGFGRSDPYPGRLPRDFVEKEAYTGFAALCRAFELTGGFVALGHSVGGGMAVVCAATAGLRCEALITESAQAFVEPLTLAGIRDAKQSFAAPGQLDRLRKHHGDKARWVLDAWTETWLDPGFADWSLDPWLPEIRCPLLALHGERDEFGSPAHPRRLAGLAGGAATVALLAGVGHVPHRQTPAAVLARVADFLGEPPSSGQ
ncbi:alpha/beta fold hydrolase [Alloalcanivorax mobilis]|uniref:alpha/beta fold hydrolase n=1 Tax=Alloalcanivorax mobilis TaxID=2019569 RepID=UPI000B5B13E4|nr:alpha/beta hydrolase [Alloalcanivorax mobilis]ASK33771.1 alpha/beta hydrolase [Alcanivorax sp. N3-2A]|tara:strand:+ start:1957 stop:2757 length:801 start_codon:yes stop_codon:yes gene_type:complete